MIHFPTAPHFFFNDPATTEIYTLSLHDALPISGGGAALLKRRHEIPQGGPGHMVGEAGDRKSTRLNSSHVEISYAVFCLKKKNVFPATFTLRHRWRRSGVLRTSQGTPSNPPQLT